MSGYMGSFLIKAACVTDDFSSKPWLVMLALISLVYLNIYQNQNQLVTWITNIFRFVIGMVCVLAKRILERLGIQISSSFFKIWKVCIPEFKANFLFFWRFYGLVLYLETIGVRIWEKVISIFAGNLNSGRSYLIAAVQMCINAGGIPR